MKRSQAGFVMLAMLVVMALALVAAALCSSVALTGEAIAQDDIGADQATAVAQAGLDDALRRLAWGEVGESTTCLGQELPAPVDDSRSRCGAYDLRFDREPAGAAGTTERITVVGREGRARSTIVAEVALEPFGLPVGLAVDGDLEARTALTLAGCGAYAGGDVFGRQFVAFDQSAPGDGLGPTTGADNAHPELWSVAGVHARGSIFDDAGEVHATHHGMAADSDCHAGFPPPNEVCSLPDAVRQAALAVRGVPPGAALQDGVLHLDLLPVTAPDGAGSPSTGFVVVAAPDAAGGLTVVGARPLPPGAPPITVLIEGDATVSAGASGNVVQMSGEFIVTGRLVVDAPCAIRGSVAAGSLSVRAPLRVELPADWRHAPAPGSLVPRVLAMD